MITNGYASLTELQEKMGITVDPNDVHKDKLETSITDASRMIDKETGTFFYTKALSSEKLDVFAPSENGLNIKNNGLEIWTPAPIISISSLTEDDTALVEDTDFYIYKSIGLMEKDADYWSFERKAIVISGSLGYAATPADIKECCLVIAATISGLWKATVQVEEGGDTIDVIRNSIPRWVFDKLGLHKWSNI